MTDGSADATCQNCGGSVHFEVEFKPGDGIRFYAECRGCHMAAWMDLPGRVE